VTSLASSQPTRANQLMLMLADIKVLTAIFFIFISITPSIFTGLQKQKICQVPLYRVSIKSFPDYKRLLQENYVE
jgi:hypothetical protein